MTSDKRAKPKKIGNVIAPTTSPEAIQLQAQKTEDVKRLRPSRSPLLIVHYSDFKTHWDWIVLALTYYTAFAGTLVAAFYIRNRSGTWIIVDTVVDIFFMIDVVVNFHTTRPGAEGEIITDLKNIRVNYLKSWFLLDVTTCIPYDAISWLAGNIDRDIRILGALKTFRLLRLVRIARELGRYLAQTYASLIFLTSLILLLSHWMGCVWFNVSLVDASAYVKSTKTEMPLELAKNISIPTLAKAESNELPNFTLQGREYGHQNEIKFENKIFLRDDDYTTQRYVPSLKLTKKAVAISEQGERVPKNWLIRLGEAKKEEFYWDWKADEMRGGPDIYSTYIACLYFSTTALISQGFGNIYGETHNEQICCIFILVIGGLLYATILAILTNVLVTISASEEQELDDKMTLIRNFAKLHELPKRIRNYMLDYTYFSWSTTHGINDKKVLSWIPEHLRLDVSVYTHRRIMKAQPSFRALSETSARYIASRMEQIHIAPGDVLVERGEEIACLYFVTTGSLEVIQNDQIVCLLGTRDTFGAMFWSPKVKKNCCPVSENTVRALTYVDLEIIRGHDLIEAMKLYSDIQKLFFRKFILTYDLSKKLSFETIQAVEWAKKVQEDPVIAKKDHQLKSWIRKIRNKKDKATQKMNTTTKTVALSKHKILGLDGEKENWSKPGVKRAKIPRCPVNGNRFSQPNSQNVVTLIPLRKPIAELYKEYDLARLDFSPSETIIKASLFQIMPDENGRICYKELPGISFSLDRMEWMSLDLPRENKELLMDILNMKVEIGSQIQYLKEKMKNCEQMVNKMVELVKKEVQK